jgi:hypothetical protein
MAPIEEKNRELTGQIFWDMKRSAIYGLDEIFRKAIARIQLPPH